MCCLPRKLAATLLQLPAGCTLTRNLENHFSSMYDAYCSLLANAQVTIWVLCLQADVLSRLPRDKVLLEAKGIRSSRRTGLPSHVPPTWPFVEAFNAKMTKQSPSGHHKVCSYWFSVARHAP